MPISDKAALHRIKMGALSIILSLSFLASAFGGAVAASGEEELDRLLFNDVPTSVPAERPLSASFAVEALDTEKAPNAAEGFKELFKAQEAPLFVGLRAYGGRTFFREGELYVSPAELFGFCGVLSDLYDDGDSMRAAVCGVEFEAVCGENYVIANGRYLWCPYGVISEDDALFVPLSAAAEAVGMTDEFDGDAFFLSGNAGAIESADGFYNGEDLYWLSRIISAESRSEALIGKIAVGNVVLNRVTSPDFPNDIYGVIFDRRFGTVQFSPVSVGSIYNEPDGESVAAAKLCLEGASVSDSILFFMNPDAASTSWISDNREAVVTIGNHTFYS
ncbi:MAG: cell wall hydrolase [Clostridia bacterium]|nr:cell wall hydrolase [Clostridia bacterium]